METNRKTENVAAVSEADFLPEIVQKKQKKKRLFLLSRNVGIKKKKKNFLDIVKKFLIEIVHFQNLYFPIFIKQIFLIHLLNSEQTTWMFFHGGLYTYIFSTLEMLAAIRVIRQKKKKKKNRIDKLEIYLRLLTFILHLCPWEKHKSSSLILLHTS